MPCHSSYAHDILRGEECGIHFLILGNTLYTCKRGGGSQEPAGQWGSVLTWKGSLVRGLRLALPIRSFSSLRFFRFRSDSFLTVATG